MKKFVLLLLVILVVSCAQKQSEESLFLEFVRKHGRNYASSEETMKRFMIFKDNLKEIAKLNRRAKNRGGLSFGITQFADITKEEFKEKYLNLKEPIMDPDRPLAPEYPSDRISSLPDHFDWREKGAVTRVKNQGSCGSCWAFSVVGNIEGQWFLAGHNLTEMSEQNLVDCDHECMEWHHQHACDAGCGGGLPPNAYNYVIKNKGIDTEESYPYQGTNGNCRYDPNKIGAKISNWTYLSHDEGQMAAWLVDNGPISIAANAEEWQFYFGGIFWIPCLKGLDHAILIAGYGHQKDIFQKDMDYWLIKNSWGSGWGEHGYIKLERGVGKCGCNEFATSVII